MSKSKLGCIFCYHGSKVRYLDNILSVIPDHEKDYAVLDLFTGGSSVASNLPDNWTVLANDKESRVVEFSQYLQQLLKVMTPLQVEEMIRNHCRVNVTSNKDKEGYDNLKERYNQGDRTPLNLFALTMSSNSNMIRFNKEGEQTLQFGNRWYNNNSRKKMLNYLENLNKKSIKFSCKDYNDFKHESFDIWIIDPPYRTSKATYSENGQWTLQDEVKLLNMCDELDRNGKNFIYFNQTMTQDVKNEVVDQWKDKYGHIVLKDTTTGCSAQRKNKGQTVEIMVHNFKEGK